MQVNFHKSQLEKLCKKCRVDAWFATSAKSGANVELAIKEVVRLALTGPYSSNFQVSYCYYCYCTCSCASSACARNKRVRMVRYCLAVLNDEPLTAMSIITVVLLCVCDLVVRVRRRSRSQTWTRCARTLPGLKRYVPLIVQQQRSIAY
jgi:hypothetical protein